LPSAHALVRRSPSREAAKWQAKLSHAVSGARNLLKRLANKKGGPERDPLKAFWEETYAYAAALTFVGTEAIVFKICEAIW